MRKQNIKPMSRKIILYIVYGDSKDYYQSAVFSILTAINNKDNDTEIAVLTENTCYFDKLNINVFSISKKLKTEWSLSGNYHFRIKNRGIAFLLKKLNIKDNDKVIFFDVDVVHNKGLNKLFSVIDDKSFVFYKNDGQIFHKKRFSEYKNKLNGKEIIVNNNMVYKINKDSCMYGSAVMGFVGKFGYYFDLADDLMLSLRKMIDSHTIEPFSLSEVSSLQLKIKTSSRYIDIYSTSAKKTYVKENLINFFAKYDNCDLKTMLEAANSVKLNRNIFRIITDKLGKNRQRVPILMYHSVKNISSSFKMKSLYVTPKSFNLQMWLMHQLGYKGLSMQELRPYLTGEKIGKVFGITFDDGYRDTFTNALPVLQKYNFSATCYIITNYIGKYNKWDEVHGIEKNPLMNKEEICSWVSAGMSLGTHTDNHFDLTQLSPESLKSEVVSSIKILQNEFSCDIVDFCYPSGSYNSDVIREVKNCNYKTATTTNRGRNKIPANLLELTRVPVNYRTTIISFFAKVLTEYENNRKK
jgi:peptidoglycan/xylan/chitin deacetylase (PgdA/CDA1 family)